MKFRLEQDTDPNNPRTDWDNLGTMVCFHKRYNLGDKHDYREGDYNGWSELRDALEEEHDPAVLLPLFLMDHSGISMSCSDGQFRACDSAGWDWGQVGYIFVSKEKVLEEWSRKRMSPNLTATVLEALKCEVTTYDQYLTGDVWGYIIEDDDGEEVDSCWGFFGSDYAKESAKEAMEAEEAEEKKSSPKQKSTITSTGTTP